jgi:hypothetical protein
MKTLAIHSETSALIKPEPRLPIAIRAATEKDLKFIDALQKKHSKEVAFASTKELLTYIKDGMALVAEEGIKASRDQGIEGTDPAAALMPGCLDASMPCRPIAYLLYRDRYMKREDCGIVSQLVVESSRHRGLVGAALVQAMLERLPYGVRLFCLWCAQDLPANHFWEALGFVPLAFRCGARGKEHGGSRREGTRLHIFWERRVREGDDYPYWYPSLTSGGRAREERLTLPIPLDKHWSDELPLVLPGVGDVVAAPHALPEGESTKEKRPRTKKSKAPATVAPVSLAASNGLRFGAAAAAAVEAKPEAPKPKPKREKHKNDPKLVRAAREFRDRYLEEVNASNLLLGAGKYDVGRQLVDVNAGTEACTTQMPIPHLLKAA